MSKNKKRFRPAEIIGKLRHADVLLGQGKKIAEVVKGRGFTDVTYYRWRQAPLWTKMRGGPMAGGWSTHAREGQRDSRSAQPGGGR